MATEPRDDAPVIFSTEIDGAGLRLSAISHTELVIKQWDRHGWQASYVLDTEKAALLLGAVAGWLQGAIERGVESIADVTQNSAPH